MSKGPGVADLVAQNSLEKRLFKHCLEMSMRLFVTHSTGQKNANETIIRLLGKTVKVSGLPKVEFKNHSWQ